ncbi:MAG: hypothetical protein GY811_03035, partial [Myxococcales bacterium]|nr:hypothetical protein [Myxococcales bacterium]
IGDITVSFAMLEMQLQSLVGSLLKETQRISQIVTAELSFKALRALILSLYRQRHEEGAEFAELRELMVSAQRLEERRNVVTHSMWAASGTPDAITRIKTTSKESKGIRFQFETTTEQDLTTLAHDIKVAAAKIQRFCIDGMNSGTLFNPPIKQG